MNPIQSTKHRRGTNLSGVRDYNERLVLTLLRYQGPLSKTAIAGMTGLTLQTISVIMRALQKDGMLVSGTPLRGKVGQPSVPMSLAAGGAYFFGLKIGRRSTDFVLIDFLGRILGDRHFTYSYPEPGLIVDFALAALGELSDSLNPKERLRIKGLGIAAPFHMWEWAEAVGAPAQAVEEWRKTDLRLAFGTQTPYPVYLENDATAACGGELVFGNKQLGRSFLYFYLGFFIGGGLALNGVPFSGVNRNAAALASMPVTDAGGKTRQLMEMASLCVLEKMLCDGGYSSETLWGNPEDWNVERDLLENWMDCASHGLAQSVLAVVSMVDFGEICLDGWLPRQICWEIMERTGANLKKLNFKGLEIPKIRMGSIGAHARALGAASLPLREKFLAEQNPFLNV